MYKGRLYVISSRKTPDDFYLEDSGQYDSGLSWSWALFTAWAFGFKLHQILHRCWVQKTGLVFGGFSWLELVHSGIEETQKSQHWALFFIKTNQGRFYFHWAKLRKWSLKWQNLSLELGLRLGLKLGLRNYDPSRSKLSLRQTNL